MENYLKKLFFLKRFYKIIILLVLDFLISIFSLWTSFSLRLGELYNPINIDLRLYFYLFFLFLFIQIYFKSYYKLSRFFNISSITYLIRNFTILFLIVYLVRLAFLKDIFFPESITLIYPIIFFLISLFKNSLLYNLYHYINENLKSSNRKVIFYIFNSKTISFLENYKKLNFYISGVVNPKKNSFKGYYTKYKIIDKKMIENYINKNGVTDIIVSSNSTYNSKIFYFRKFLKLNVRVIFLNDIYNTNNLSYTNEIFEPKIEDIIEKNQIENKEKNKI